MKACKVITKIWKIAQARCNGIPNAAMAILAEYITVIRIKINSPAYMLPNKRKASEIGLANKVTVSRIKLTGINAQ